ncbi:MAG: SGNH/GDSL hydrolase family protein [Victivallales bacterium]
MTSRIGKCRVNASFADFDRRAEKGERLTVAFLGGSLTWGARSSDPQKTSYRAIVGQNLKDKYPKAHFNFVDAAIGGSGAQLGAFRLQRDVLAYRPDLLFLDFTLNDSAHSTTPDTLAAHEAIIRRVISEADCPVIQMFFAAKNFVTEGTTEKMKRRASHIDIAKAYNLPCGDAIVLMQEKYRKGKIVLDEIWPPETFDNTHPCDKGYALYAEAAWNAFNRAVSGKIVCRVPEKMLNADTYMHVSRVKISSLNPLPKGWRTASPSTVYCAFDFLMSRWLDDVSVASNFKKTARDKPAPAEPAQTLELKFSGSSVLLFGESTPRSCMYRITIDGQTKEFNACQLGQTGIGRMWQVVAETLDPSVEHNLEIQPVFESPEKPQELCLESICVAGGRAKVWRSR